MQKNKKIRYLGKCLFFQVFVGGHGSFGEDGYSVPAAESVGRRDYGRPRCSRDSNSVLGGCNSVWGRVFGGARRDNVFTNDIALIR